MGLTVLELEVGNPANPEVTEKLEFLIDSGAIYSVVPAPILERLGIKPLADQEFRLADGTKITRKKGIALFKYGGRVGGADVIFGEEGHSVLLGAFTLEALGLSLDPLRRQLKPLPMILAQFVKIYFLLLVPKLLTHFHEGMVWDRVVKR
ncbi:MAG: aspartyl protease family protein [Candidatus Brocadia sp.]